MLRRGAKVDPRTPNGNTPFLFAVGTALVDVAMVLATHGCDINAATYGGRGQAGAQRCGHVLVIFQ